MGTLVTEAAKQITDHTWKTDGENLTNEIKNDSICTCGYKFSDNADLSVLWIDGAFPIKNFKKDVTEYEVKAHTYKDFEEVKFSTFTYDSEATVEYPEDLSLKAGKNVFEIKVTSENLKVTKTYTVTVVK